ncbi:porin family protein [Ravibacter arvi]
MKKTILFFALLVGISGGAYAQGFGFGPKAGLNISNYTGGNVKTDALVGYHLGGMLNFGIGNVFSIQPEVLFSTQGAKIDNQGAKEDFKVSYVSVPVMLKFKTSGGFYIEAGPQASFKTGEKIGSQTIDSFAKNLDLAVGGGIGFQSKIGLGIGGRYVAGISKVGDFTTMGNVNPDFKNSIIQLSLFWMIPVTR